jgi:hypothetical protein
MIRRCQVDRFRNSKFQTHSKYRILFPSLWMGPPIHHHTRATTMIHVEHFLYVPYYVQCTVGLVEQNYPQM